MNCPEMETIAGYAEDALDLEDALPVATHLKLCPVCSSDAEDMRGFVRQHVAQVLASMPGYISPFVGREETLEELGKMLAAGENQSFELCAPPGIGKTRLTLETAVERSYLVPDGVWYVPLSEGDSTSPAGDIARAIDLPLQAKISPIKQLREFFSDKRALLVVDDLESNMPAVELLSELQSHSPELISIMTSRESSRDSDRRILTLDPLRTVPSQNRIELLRESESVRMFLGHVRRFQPNFGQEDEDIFTAAALCRKAGGVPLAIELAAARGREMSPSEILSRIDSSAVTSPEHSLRNMMAWSVQLLTPEQKQILINCSVFVEGFSGEQTENIGGTLNTAAALESLTEKALILRGNASGAVRYQMLRPIREFVRQQRGHEELELQRKHSLYFMNFANVRTEQVTGPRQVEAIRELSTDLPNLRAGMEWAEQHREYEITSTYGIALHRFMVLQGLWQECEDRLRQTESAFRFSNDVRGVERAQIALARTLMFKGEYEEADSLLSTISEHVHSEDMQLLAEVRQGLGNSAQLRGLYPEAERHIEEALKYFELAADRFGVADSKHNLGWLAWMQGDYPSAEQLLNESLILQRERGDRYRLGTTLACLGNIAYEQNRLEEARLFFSDSLQLRQELNDVRGIASAMNNMGMVWMKLGDFTRADYCYERAISRLENIGDRRTLGQTIDQYGELALAKNDIEQARALFVRSKDLLLSVENRHGAATALTHLSIVEERQDNLAEAIALQKQSLQVLQETHSTSDIVHSLYRLGTLFARNGETEQAITILSAVYAHLRTLNLPDAESCADELKKIGAALESSADASNTISLDEIVTSVLL